jgi:hypothetical protein
MNPYKQEREKFFRKHFNYPNQLEAAIRVTKPTRFYETTLKGDQISHLKRIDHRRFLLRYLNKYGYDKFFNWQYTQKGTYQIYFYTRLTWKPTEGLGFSFQRIEDYPYRRVEKYREETKSQRQEAAQEMRDYLFPKLRVLFGNFYPVTFLDQVELTGFWRLLTDEQLNRLVVWS